MAVPVKGVAPDAAETALLDTVWQVEEVRGRVVGEAPQTPELRLESGPSRVTGNTGCNSLTGSYSLEGPSLSFSQIIVSMRACAQGMKGESALLKALGEVASWRLEGDHLLLVGAGRSVVLRLAREGVSSGPRSRSRRGPVLP